MKRKSLIIFVFILLFIRFGYGQTNPGITDDLVNKFSRIRENISSSEKLAINDSIKTIIESYCESDSVFRHRFTNLRFLGQITSPDSLVKIITWNLILPDGANRYFCNFIKKSDVNSRNEVYKLSGLYNEGPIRTDTIYSDSDWYGALYYDIRPFKTGNSTSYVLLGIDYGNSFVTRKIIDVLTFSPGNKLIFGKRCFTDGKITLPRIVFEFSSRAVMSLRFSPEGSIIFDHLSPAAPEYNNNRQFWGPDFTFDSYVPENGMFHLKSNIDVRNNDK